MATIALSKLILRDNWPGVADPNLGEPVDGFDSTKWNFSTADVTSAVGNPPYPYGTKIQAYTDNTECPGYYTMIYLARHEMSSECISSDISTGIPWVSPAFFEVSKSTLASGVDVSMAPWYLVQSCYSGSLVISGGATGSTGTNAPIAMACCTVDADSSITLGGAEYSVGYGHSLGWYWCGGVCPCGDISFYRGLRDSKAGACITAVNQERGPIYFCATATGVYVISDPSVAATTAAQTCPPIGGWACASAV